MNALVARFGSERFACLGFPCNQFGHQENGSNDEILNSLKHVRPGNGFEPAFDLSVKVEVNGASEEPIFRWLKSALPMPYDVEDCNRGDAEATNQDFLADSAEKLIWSPIKRTDIGWNFEKFLVGPDGVPFRRYSRFHSTAAIASDIEELSKQIK